MKYCWPLASIPQIKCSFIKSHICAFQKIVIIMFSLKCTNTIPKDGDHWRYGNWNVKWFDQFRWTDGQCLFLVDFGTEFFVLSSSVVISITIVVVIHIFPFFPSFYILNILILPIAITINSGGDMHMHCASEFCVWFICSQFYGIKLTFKMKNYEPELSILVSVKLLCILTFRWWRRRRWWWKRQISCAFALSSQKAIVNWNWQNTRWNQAKSHLSAVQNKGRSWLKTNKNKNHENHTCARLQI